MLQPLKIIEGVRAAGGCDLSRFDPAWFAKADCLNLDGSSAAVQAVPAVQAHRQQCPLCKQPPDCQSIMPQLLVLNLTVCQGADFVPGRNLKVEVKVGFEDPETGADPTELLKLGETEAPVTNKNPLRLAS